jgi:hypothetical protein
MLSIGGLSKLGLGQLDDFCTCRALPCPRQSVVERAVSLRMGLRRRGCRLQRVDRGDGPAASNASSPSKMTPKRHPMVFMPPALLLAEKWCV